VNLIWNAYYPNGELPQPSKGRGSFWWKDLLKLMDTFRGIAQCMVGDGTTIMFWSDMRNGHLLQQKFSMLYSYAWKKTSRWLNSCKINQIEHQFHIPLSVQAFQEYQTLKKAFSRPKSPQGRRTTRDIFGGMPYTPHPSLITFHTEMFNPTTIHMDLEF
jgi:hypothetical protein